MVQTILLTLGVLVSSLVPLGLTITAGLLIGSIPAAVRGGLASPAGRGTLQLLAAISVLIVIPRVLGPFQLVLANVLGRAVDRRLEARLMAAVSTPSGIGHLEEPATLDLVKNAEGVGTGPFHPGMAVAALADLLPDWIHALGSAVILVTFHWWLALLWLVIWLILLHYLMREYIRVGEAAIGQAAVVRRSDYFRDLALTPGPAKEVRIWGLGDWLTTRFDAAWLRAMQPIWRTRQPNRSILWIATGVIVVANLGSLGLLAWAATRGDLGLAALAVYSRAVLDASNLRAFDDANTNLAYAAVSVPSLLELERRMASLQPLKAQPGLPPEAPRAGIRLEDVTFRYAGQARAVLDGLDLDVPAGRSLAIVGANGVGKTTLIKLLCRLYDPTGGRIVVDGIDLRGVDPVDWQRRVAAIFQDFAQYQLTARENVGLGAPAFLNQCTLLDDDRQLRAAARKAGALELIEALPRSWETILSRQYTGGVDLSGGQWQRIALARALFAVAGGARVLILDEPTASLDVRAEAELYERFLEITAGLTTIIISHRFSTVRRADTICVLNDGRVVERGTHDELMALAGRYATMFSLQASRFADGPTAAADEGV